MLIVVFINENSQSESGGRTTLKRLHASWLNICEQNACREFFTVWNDSL